MLNGNEKPKTGLPGLLAMVPGPAVIIALIVLVTWLSDEIWNIPRWLELTGWGLAFVIFLYWLITGSRK